MSAKNVRHFLFWTSITCWILGFIVAAAEQQGQLSKSAAVDAFALFVLGAFMGTIWLLLALVKLAARTWRQERADSANL